jgi:hypothetical protein
VLEVLPLSDLDEMQKGRRRWREESKEEAKVRGGASGKREGSGSGRCRLKGSSRVDVEEDGASSKSVSRRGKNETKGEEEGEKTKKKKQRRLSLLCCSVERPTSNGVSVDDGNAEGGRTEAEPNRSSKTTKANEETRREGRRMLLNDKTEAYTRKGLAREDWCVERGRTEKKNEGARIGERERRCSMEAMEEV